jgi:hypothetical protein
MPRLRLAPGFGLFVVLSVLFPIGAAGASEQDALSISENIQRLHLPYDTILDPVFASSDPNSPAYSEVVSYARAGDSALWTGHYLAAEAFRYQVTGDSSALDNAWRALRGIHTLLDITGSGLLARCALPVSSPYAAAIQAEEGRHGIYYASVAGEPYFWIGNTSRDQYSGVMFGLSVAFDMINDPDMKSMIRSDVTRILNYLLARGWNVVMPDGSISTTFVHRPDQKLTFLQIGRRVDPSRFSALYSLNRFLYASAVGLPIYVDNADEHGSYFKFNLNYINLYNLVRLEADGSSYKRSYMNAYDALRTRTAHHGNAYFNMVDRELKGPDGVRDNDTVAMLQVWLQRPRRDYWLDWRGEYSACGDDNACNPIPVERRINTDFLWQRSPFLLFGGGFGTRETPGIDYILPYWMARQKGLTP